jgi:hypothetical protein
MVKSIADITKKYPYKDEFPNGKGDPDLVACGQLHELEYIWKNYILKHIENGTFTRQEALDAMDKCCAERRGNKRDRESYYLCLSQLLGVKIGP